MTNLQTSAVTLLICFALCTHIFLLVIWAFRKLYIHPSIHLSDWSECMLYVWGCMFTLYLVFFFFFSFYLADSHPSYPPSMCVKREPHEASFAPFTPSSVEDSTLADILSHQSSLSVDASTPSYPAHAHGHCYSQYANQPFIAGTTLPIRPCSQIKPQSSSLFSVDLPLCSFLIT